MTRIVRDLDFLTSVGLLVSALVTATTGVIADLWDLNDFWYHTISGYVMGVFGIAHVWLNRERLLGYARFRWRALRATGLANAATRPVGAAATRVAVRDGDPEPIRPSTWLGRALVSRRGLLGLTIGAVGGTLLGRGLRPAPPIEAGSDVGVIYHQWSKPGVLDAFGSVSNWGQPVDLYKTYPGAPTVALPPVALDVGLDRGLATARTIVTRRSTRAYAPTPMSLEELSRLLFLSGGITAGLHGNARRAAPSSGALYPIELYPVVHRVNGVEPGVYHYAYREHALERVRAGDFRASVVEQGIAQEFLGE